MAIIKHGKVQYLNPLEAGKIQAQSNPLFNDYDWENALRSGQANAYLNAIDKLKGIDANKFYSDWNLYNGDKNNRLMAIIAEAGADRSNIRELDYVEGGIPGMKTIYENVDGKYKPVRIEGSDYAYIKNAIKTANKMYSEKVLLEEYERSRLNNEGFSAFLNNTVIAPVANFAYGVYGTIANLWSGAVGFTFALSDEMLPNFNHTGGDFSENLLDYTSAVQTTTGLEDLSEQLADFEYRYTTYINEEGEYKLSAEIVKGISTTIGQMLPTVVPVVGQPLFYVGNILVPTMVEDYKYSKENNLNISSRAILSKAVITSLGQYAIEVGLQKLLGATGLDKLIWGKKGSGAVKLPTTGKTIINFASHLGKDALQEGLEEALQETSDFFVNQAFKTFVNDNFQEVKWDWETIGLSALIGALTSIVGSSAQLVGVQRVNTGKFKTNKNGEIVTKTRKDGTTEYQFEKLSKLQSWQFGLDMQSMLDSYQSILNAGEVLSNSSLDTTNTKAESQYKAALYQATIAYKFLSEVYGEVGAEQFNKANDILKVMTADINAGKFDSDTHKKLLDVLDLDFKKLAAKYNVDVLVKMHEAGMTEIEGSMKNGEVDISDESSAEALYNLQRQSGINDDETVIITKDGDRIILDEENHIVVMPKNLLLGSDSKVLIEDIAVAKLADSLVEGVLAKTYYYKNHVAILTDLYSQWVGTSEVDAREAIYTLIFDPRFFEAVLATNEKLSSTFALRLNGLLKNVSKEKDIRNRVLTKKINECRTRWIKAASHFYANNLETNTDEFTKSLDKSQREEFEKDLKATLQLYNMGSSIILEPDKVSDNIWSFVGRRINNMNVDEATKTQLLEDIKNLDPLIRERALTKISDYYDGAFMSLYDGRHYLTKTSFTNEIFNAFLERKGLFIYQLFDEKYLTAQERNSLGDDFTTDDIVNLRRNQVNEYNENLKLEYKNDNIVLTSEKGEDGFQFMQTLLKEKRAAIIQGDTLVIGDDKVNRKIVTDIKSNNKWLKSLLKSSIIEEYMADWLTIDDIVNHPEYLSDEIYDMIYSEYGSVNRMTVYQWIGLQLADSTNGKQSLIMRGDGTVAIGDMTAIDDIYVEGAEITEGQYRLTKLLNVKHLTGILANTVVEVNKGIKQAEYVDYDKVLVDGKYVRVFVNKIRLPAYESQAKARFALSHEVQHALQVEMKLNQGIGSTPLSWFSKNKQAEIIKEVIKMSPELFTNIPKAKRVSDNLLVQQIVNDYIYYGSGETQAMGLGGVGQVSFYPIRVTRKNGNTVITFKNGKQFAVKNEVNSNVAASRIMVDTQDSLNKNYEKYNITKADDVTLEKMATQGKNLGAKLLFADNVSADEAQELMYYKFGFNDTLENFKEQSVIVVEIDNDLYVIPDIDTFNQLIRTVQIRQQNDKIRIGLGYTQVKNIKTFNELVNVNAGLITVNKTNIKGRRYTETDLSQVPQSTMSQNLDVVSGLTGEVLEDEVSLENLVPNVVDLLTDLSVAGFKFIGNNNNTILDVLNPIKDNIELSKSLYEYLYNKWGVEIDESVKQNVLNNITTDDRVKTITKLMQDNGVDVDFETFINMDLPIYRYQTASNLFVNTPFVSVNFDYDIKNIPLEFRLPDFAGADNRFYGYFIGGTIKLKDCLLVLQTDFNNVEILVPPNKISNIVSKEFARTYNMSVRSTGVMYHDFYERLSRDDYNNFTEEFIDGKFTIDDLEDWVNDLLEYVNRIDDYDRKYLKRLSDSIFSSLKRLNEKRVDFMKHRILATITSRRADMGKFAGLAGDDIWVAERYEENAIVILHELLHIVTQESFINNDKAAQIFNKIYNNINSKTKLFYGQSNPREMVAELANPDFREFLKTQNLYASTLAEIAKITGIAYAGQGMLQPVNALQEIMKALDMVFEEYSNYQSIMSQNLVDDETLKEYGIYNGLLYKDGKQYKKDVQNLSGILVLDSDNETMLKAKNFVVKVLRKYGIEINSDEDIVLGLRKLAMNKPEVFETLMNKLYSSINAFQHILLGDTFIVLDGKIDNVQIETGNETKAEVAKDTSTLDVKKETPIEQSEESSIEVGMKSKLRKPKVSNLEIDRRKNKDDKFNYDSKIHTATETRDIYKSKGYKLKRVIKKADIWNETKELAPVRKNADYIFRDFVERRIYEVGKDEKVVDIYVYYHRKKYNERRHTLAEERDTYVKYYLESKNKNQVTMNPGLRDFLVKATNMNIDKEIVSKIKNATLTVADLENYITQDVDDIDLTTFKLINETIFKNPYINTPQELHKLALDLGPKMAAMYLILKDTEFKDYVMNEAMDLDRLEKAWLTFSQQPKYSKELNKIIEAFGYNVSLKKFSQRKAAEGKYDTLNGDVLDKQSLYQIMRNFDGNIASGSYAVLSARYSTYRNSLDYGDGFWDVKFGIKHFESLESTVGEDKEGKESTKTKLDTIGDDNEFVNDMIDALDYAIGNKFINQIRKELLNVNSTLGKFVYESIAKVTYVKGESATQATNYWENYKKAFQQMTEEEKYDWYEQFIKNSSEDKLRQIFALANLSTDSVNLFENYTPEVKEAVSQIRSNANKAQKIYRKILTIKNNIKGKNYKYFLQENKDIFNSDFTIKESALKEEVNGETVWKTERDIESLNERISELVSAARAGAYDSKSNFDRYINSKKAEEKARKELLKAITTERKVGKETIRYVPITYYDVDGEVTINVRGEIPEILNRVLSIGLSKRNKSNVLNLSLDDENHLAATIESIFDDNFTYLLNVSEDEAIDFLNFFVNHGIMSTDTESSRIAIQVESMLAAYFLGKHRYTDAYNFDNELIESVRKRLNDLGTFAGQLLNTEKFIKKMLDPNEKRAQNLSKDLGIELDEEDKANLNELLKSMQNSSSDWESKKKKFKETLLRKYKGKKRNLWSKLLTFENAMMLSNPGTMFRNLTSNVITVSGNVAGENIGNNLSKILVKVFPKSRKAFLTDDTVYYTKNTKDGPVRIGHYQYKMNLKVSKANIEFIHEKFIKSGLLNDTIDGLSKYDLDKLDHAQSADNLLDMIARSIAQDIRRNEVFATGKFAESKSAKFTDNVIGLIYKGISDDPFVKSRTKRYLGKILEEEYNLAKKTKPNLTFDQFVNTPDSKSNMYGISNTVAVAYAKAVNLASADFMRNPNFFSLLERTMRENWSDGAYFLYKQVFPFVSTSWSWCVEAIRYSPLGLASAIIKLARLENTLANMDKKHQQGKSVIHPEFTRYWQIRNLGKGVIGIGLFVLGMLLRALGWAGIDEEDEKYKIFVGDVKISIDDILASQGITMGMACMGLFDKDNDKDFIAILGTIFDEMFRDSIFEDAVYTFRRSNGVSDFFLKKASDIPTLFIPNFFKAISSVALHRGVIYNDNYFLERLQRYALQMLPGAPAELVGASTQVDIYTGERQSVFGDGFWKAIISKFTPIDISWPSVSENELEAISQGVRKGQLSGNYTVDGESVNLSNDETMKLNSFYGKLNNDDLSLLRTNRNKVKVKMNDGSYKLLTYSQMTDEQKSAAFNTIMSNNSALAKIYILTDTGKYKYYASDSEYQELRKLGVTKNIYKATNKNKGFVKIS